MIENINTDIERTDRLNQQSELGKVSWYRDYDQALAIARAENKPVLLFFQEVPGCCTCVTYGKRVLSNPLMVEFIENEFVPLVIFNNIPGKDAEILAKYGEPSWNNPVTRFVDGNGKDISARMGGEYHPLDLYKNMVNALSAFGKDVPQYAKVLHSDLLMEFTNVKTTIYETPCFWSGETTMAQHPAVIYTEAGWIHGAEVVMVVYDSAISDREDLDEFAQSEGFFLINGHGDYKIDKRPQYYLHESKYSSLPLSKAQRMKINLALPYRLDPAQYLSPNQRTLLLGNNSTRNKTYQQRIEESWNFNN